MSESQIMAMMLQTLGDGNFRITQELRHPVIYLDHWAVRLFSENMPLQDRFVDALHRSGGTWLFSTANLFEYVAMTDLNQAVSAEKLILRVLPSLHVADTTIGKGFLFPEGAPQSPHSPQNDWLLDDLAYRAKISGGCWNTNRFVQDAIKNRDQLLPLFNDMKAGVSVAVMSLTKNENKSSNAKKFVPKAGMTLRDALYHEFLRDPHVNPGYKFDNNDAMDLIHAVPSAVVCDFVLLDSRWCHRLQSADARIKKAGIKGRVARCFSKKTVANFLSAIETEVSK